MKDDPHHGVFTFGPFQVDTIGRSLRRDGMDVPIGSRAFDLLVTLIRKPGEVISNRELLAFAWPGLCVEDSNIRVQMTRLRRTIGCGVQGARYIASVAGRGYCFVEPVTKPVAGNLSVEEGTKPVEVDGSNTQSRPGTLQGADKGQRLLPACEQRLVGRDSNLEELDQAIRQERLVTVLGPGGVGKTSVAITVARRIEGFDTIHFVDFSTIVDPDCVLPTVASAICVGAEARDTTLERLIGHVSARCSLIILDNCEHVIGAVAEIANVLLLRADRVHILATSREALRLPGETIHLLNALAVPPAAGRLTAKRALSWPSVDLFMQRAARGGYREGLTDERACVVAAACRQLDGNPLAIELVAARVGTYGLEKVALLVDDELTLRWRGSRAASARHQTIQAMLDWSYNLLSGTSKRVLDRLSVFAGQFSREAAITVAVGGDIGPDDVSEAIGDLLEKSLLQIARAGDRTGTKLLEITKTYARSRLEQSGEGACARRRHALYYMERLRSFGRGEDAAVSKAAMSAFEVDLDDIPLALEWAFGIDGDVELAVEMCAMAVSPLLRLWRLPECSKWCMRALETLPEKPRGTRIELDLLEGLSVAMFYMSEHLSETEAILQRGLALSRALNDSDRQFHLLAGLQLLSLRSGDFRRSLELAKRYASEAVIRGGPTENMIAEWLLGTAFHMLGDQRLAHKAYMAGFERADGSHRLRMGQFERTHQALARVGQARVLWLRGAHVASAKLAEEAVAAARSDTGSLCICLLVAAEILLLCGEHERAGRLVKELNHLAQRYCLVGLSAAGLAMLNQLQTVCGYSNDGIDLLRSHAGAVHSLGLAGATLGALASLAQGLTRSGAHDEAVVTIDAALLLDEQCGGTFRSPELMRLKAEIIMASSNPRLDFADALLTKALVLSRDHSSVSWELRITITIARLRMRRGLGTEGGVLSSLKEFLSQFDTKTDSADLRCANLLLQRASAGGSNFVPSSCGVQESIA